MNCNILLYFDIFGCNFVITLVANPFKNSVNKYLYEKPLDWTPGISSQAAIFFYDSSLLLVTAVDKFLGEETSNSIVQQI